MTFASTAAGNVGVHLTNARINWGTDTIKVMLCVVAFVPSKDTTIWKSDVTNEVASGNGYTTGGLTLASKTGAYDSATDTTVLDAADAIWTTAAGQTLTYRVYVIYKDTGTGSTSPVVAWGVETLDQTASNGGTATITFDATGIVRLPT